MKKALLLVPFLLPATLWGQQHSETIRLNQLGFYPEALKTAMITAAGDTRDFFILATHLRDTLYRGELSDTLHSKHSSLVTRKADFSSFAETGAFVLAVPGQGLSPVFRIGDNLLSDVGKACLKGFYYQRSSVPLLFAHAGKWQRSAGHPDTEVQVHPSAASKERPAGTSVPSPGGWYDAGDYNKYIVNSGITMNTLLTAFAHYPTYFSTLETNIPESGNGAPDILDEAVYNLRWMLTMQDSTDGGVYHKCTNAAFDGMVLPGVGREPRYVVQKSTAAALDFAAVTAQAARVLAPFGRYWPGLADSCRSAALKAWDWATRNPALIYDQDEINRRFDPDLSTGTYGDGSVQDEWLWAAAEMFRMTLDTKFLKRLKEQPAPAVTLPTWNNVGLLAFYSLLDLRGEVPEEYQEEWMRMRAAVVQLADAYLKYQSLSAFEVPMGQSAGDFVWGSNANAANQGILLLFAHRITGKQAYLDAALANADYLLGRNATGYCFVTGFGSKSPMRPHHRQSVADGIAEPVPGLLVGGPNPFRQDGCTYAHTERETAYTDDDCSYASNEIAINWNAPAAFLFNALEALLRKK